MIPAALFSAIVSCAPHVDRGIMVGITARESSVSPWEPISDTAPNMWQINDNTAKRSYNFADYRTAVDKTTDLVYREHHTVAIGIAQILSPNVFANHVTIAEAFQPCVNLSLAQNILTWNYTYAVRSLHVSPGVGATFVALEMYYAGMQRDAHGVPAYEKPNAAEYASAVMQTAAAFNGRYALPAPTKVLGALPMPEHPWPARGAYVPVASYATPPPQIAIPPTPATAVLFRAQLPSAQRILEAALHKRTP